MGFFCEVMEEHIQNLYQLFLQHPKVSTDTRKNVHDTLFFALSGNTFNGNEFAESALQKGAAFAVIDDANFKKSEKYFLVPDVLKALQQLAAHHRKMSGVHVLAITGSNGKTTTKELLATVLQSEKKIIATKGNLNNHIGVPLTLLSIKGETETAVVEMGANHIGEIAALCEIAQPNSGLITNIGKAHLEGFGSFEGVVTAKNELFVFLSETNGMAIVNADDELLMKLSDTLKRTTYGISSGEVQGKLLETHPFLKLQWSSDNETHICNTNLYGSYNFSNLMAAVTIGKYFGISPENINQSIADFVPNDNRSQQLKTEKNKIILDAYNANPVSLSEAIKSFAAFNPEKPWLILGDMFELGKDSIAEHQSIIRQVEETGFENVLLVGEDFYEQRKTGRFLFFESTEQIEAYLKMNPIEDASILIKGSRGMHLETLVKYL